MPSWFFYGTYFCPKRTSIGSYSATRNYPKTRWRESWQWKVSLLSSLVSATNSTHRTFCVTCDYYSTFMQCLWIAVGWAYFLNIYFIIIKLEQLIVLVEDPGMKEDADISPPAFLISCVFLAVKALWLSFQLMVLLEGGKTFRRGTLGRRS